VDGWLGGGQVCEHVCEYIHVSVCVSECVGGCVEGVCGCVGVYKLENWVVELCMHICIAVYALIPIEFKHMCIKWQSLSWQLWHASKKVDVCLRKPPQ